MGSFPPGAIAKALEQLADQIVEEDAHNARIRKLKKRAKAKRSKVFNAPKKDPH